MVLSADSRVSNNSIDDLIRELEELRIQSERLIREIERTVRENRRREARLEQRIERARTAFNRGNRPNNHANNRVNPFAVGDTVRITNYLRNDRGTTGIVVSSTARMVTLRTDESRLYTRAHWNIEHINTGVNNAQ